MEANNGFIKLHRQFLNWQWYTEPNVMRVFLHLLLKATFKEFKWKEENISKGQVIVGRKRLAEELKISESQVRTALKKLERSGEIAIKSTNKYSVITIRKWDFFQNEKGSFANKSPTNSRQIANKSPHMNNKKNVKKYSNAPGRERENSSIDFSLLEQIINAD